MNATERRGTHSEPASPRIGALLDRYPVAEPPTDRAGAAVLIVLREGAQDVETLLIERTVRPADRASGQIALPGGHVQNGDRSLADTALRECAEEVGIGPADLRGSPRFVSIETARAFSVDVAVFATELGDPGPGPSAYSPDEVASIFWFPRSALEHSERVLRPTYRGPIEVPAVRYADHILWGFTRGLLLRFFEFPDDPEEERLSREPASGPDLSASQRIA